MKIEFKVGDLITNNGLTGVVWVIDDQIIYPLLVAYDDNKNMERFTIDGKTHPWHKEPSLKLVRRAEEFEEVVGYQPIKCDESLSWESDYFYESKEDALNQSNTIGYREIKYMRRKV